LRYNAATVSHIVRALASSKNHEFWEAVLFFYEHEAMQREKRSEESLFICHEEVLERRLFEHHKEPINLA
jgi:hypothetical protein